MAKQPQDIILPTVLFLMRDVECMLRLMSRSVRSLRFEVTHCKVSRLIAPASTCRPSALCVFICKKRLCLLNGCSGYSRCCGLFPTPHLLFLVSPQDSRCWGPHTSLSMDCSCKASTEFVFGRESMRQTCSPRLGLSVSFATGYVISWLLSKWTFLLQILVSCQGKATSSMSSFH